MTKSLERFTPEQFELMVRDWAQKLLSESDEKHDVNEMLRILGKQAVLIPVASSLHLERGGHKVCCPTAAMAIFGNGFLYGWLAREVLLEKERLEGLFGDAVPEAEKDGGGSGSL